MDKLWFSSDYMEGAHPRLLQRLTDTNLEQTPGYGRDEYCESARSRIREACLRHGLLLYVDGARLAYALCSPENDVTLADLARLADAFYIGGTKCGCLMGEAAVLPNPSLLPHFFTIIKQHGALLAKSRLLGLQFDELFRDGLYLQLGRDAVAQAERIQEAVLRGSGRLLERTHTNQVFLVLTNRQADALAERVVFSVRDPYDAEHSVVRLVTGWATRPEDVDALCRLLEAF